MYNTVKVSDKVYYLGVNDRRTSLFENMWPIPNGVSYNSYLIVDEKVALVDTLEFGHSDDYLDKIEEIIQEASEDEFSGEFLKEKDIETCGKSRILLGGAAEEIHQQNLRHLYRKIHGEDPKFFDS